MQTNEFNKSNELKCPKCGSTIEYATGSRYVCCNACGSEYVQGGNIQLTPLIYEGGVIFQAYLPDGWNYNVAEDIHSESCHELAAYAISAWSPDANLFFYPKAYYKDCSSLEYNIDGATVNNYHKYLPIEEYVPQRLREVFPQAQNISVRSTHEPLFEQKAYQFAAQSQSIVSNLKCVHGKYEFSLSLNGQTMHGLFGTIICYCASEDEAEQSSPSAAQSLEGTQGLQSPREQEDVQTAQGLQKPSVTPDEVTKNATRSATAKDYFNMFMRGGIIGAKMRGEQLPGRGNKPAKGTSSETSSKSSSGGGFLNSLKNIGRKIMGNNWGRAFDVILVTPVPNLSLYDGIFNDFALNVNYGPQYTVMQQQAMATIQNAQMQATMRVQQSQIAASRHISQSIAQRNDIIMSGYEQRTARMNHMHEQYSEALRGVNSYTDSYGQKVEASVRYDHVYQNGNGYIASDGNLNLGPGWQELKRND